MELESLKILIDEYFVNNPDARNKGRITKRDEFDGINKKVLKNIPDWYKELLMNYPLVDQEIGIPNDFGQEEYIGKPFEELPLMGITFISVKEIENHSLNIFPDCELLNRNYIRIAEDKFSTQEGIFINIKDEDPPVLLLFHDFGETGKEVLEESEKLLEKFTDIFRYGRSRDLASNN